MKPFDLQKALAGGKVVTRDGREVTQLHYFNGVDTESVYGVIGDKVFKWFSTGKYYSNGSEIGEDLFMAPKEVTLFFGVYRGELSGEYILGNPCKEDADAKKQIVSPVYKYICTKSITVEEV